MQCPAVICLVLIEIVSLASANDRGCGEEIDFRSYKEAELSFLETVLLFPLSLTGKILPPKDCNTGFGFTDVKRVGRWLLNAGAATGAAFTGTFSACVGVFGDVADVIDLHVQKLQTFIYSIDYEEVLHNVLDYGHVFLSGQLQYAGSRVSLVRYVLAVTLAVSLIPLLAWNARQIGRFRRSKGEVQIQKTPRSKRFLEQDIETSSFKKFYMSSLSPILESSLEGRNSPRKKRKLANTSMLSPAKAETQTHYQMCEIFDQLPCNCGGKKLSPIKLDLDIKNPTDHALDNKRDSVNGSPAGLLFTENMFKAEKNDQSPDKIVYTEHFFRNKKDQLLDKVLYTEHIYQNKKDRSPDRLSDKDSPKSPQKKSGAQRESRSYRKRSTSPRKKLHLIIGDHLPDHVMDSASDHVVPGGAGHVTRKVQPGDGTAGSPQRGTLELYEREAGGAELDMSFSSDIGQPCFNSSFKEESLFVIHDAENGPVGDGPAIITRRSPRKQLGLSFERSGSGSSASLCGGSSSMFEETGDDLAPSEYGESRLEFSSMSNMGTGGGGLFEFAVILAVERVYSWSKRFLRRRSRAQYSQGGRVSSDNVNDSSNSAVSWPTRPAQDIGDPNVADSNAEDGNISANAIETDVDTGHSQLDTSFVESTDGSIDDSHRLVGGNGLYLGARESSADAACFDDRQEKRRTMPADPIDYGNRLKYVQELSVDHTGRGVVCTSPVSGDPVDYAARYTSPRSMGDTHIDLGLVHRVDSTDVDVLNSHNSIKHKAMTGNSTDIIVPYKSPRSSENPSDTTDFLVVRRKSPRSRGSSMDEATSDNRRDRQRSRESSIDRNDIRTRLRNKIAFENDLKELQKTEAVAQRLKYGRTLESNSTNVTSDLRGPQRSYNDGVVPPNFRLFDTNFSNNAAAVTAEERSVTPADVAEMCADVNTDRVAEESAATQADGVDVGTDVNKARQRGENVDNDVTENVNDVGYLGDHEMSASLDDWNPECDQHLPVSVERSFQELDDVD